MIIYAWIQISRETLDLAFKILYSYVDNNCFAVDDRKSIPKCFHQTEYLLASIIWSKGFPGGSVVKNQPAIQETWAQSLGQEDTLEKELVIYSSIIAWRIAWTEEPGGLQSM